MCPELINQKLDDSVYFGKADKQLSNVETLSDVDSCFKNGSNWGLAAS